MGPKIKVCLSRSNHVRHYVLLHRLATVLEVFQVYKGGTCNSCLRSELKYKHGLKQKQGEIEKREII